MLVVKLGVIKTGFVDTLIVVGMLVYHMVMDEGPVAVSVKIPLEPQTRVLPEMVGAATLHWACKPLNDRTKKAKTNKNVW